MDKAIAPSRWPRLFARSAEAEAASRLLAAVIHAARAPSLFGEGRLPDDVNGRLESLYLHGALALRRLKPEPDAADTAQIFADRLFRHLDEGLREVGVGDLSVPKTMKRFAGQFYGRLDAYANALAARDPTELRGAVARNVFGGRQDHPFLDLFSTYVERLDAQLAAEPWRRLMDTQTWRVTTP